MDYKIPKDRYKKLMHTAHLYQQLQLDLSELVEEWQKKSNGKDYYDPATFADELKELLEGE